MKKYLAFIKGVKETYREKNLVKIVINFLLGWMILVLLSLFQSYFLFEKIKNIGALLPTNLFINFEFFKLTLYLFFFYFIFHFLLSIFSKTFTSFLNKSSSFNFHYLLSSFIFIPAIISSALSILFQNNASLFQIFVLLLFPYSIYFIHKKYLNLNKGESIIITLLIVFALLFTLQFLLFSSFIVAKSYLNLLI